MIKVEDSTIREFERHRLITLDGTEKEMDRLAGILEYLDINCHQLSHNDHQFFHDFVHTFRRHK